MKCNKVKIPVESENIIIEYQSFPEIESCYEIPREDLKIIKISDEISDELIESIKHVILKYGTGRVFERSTVPLIYILLNIYPEILIGNKISIKIKIKSENLPIGAGLGSSAAFSVSVVSSLLLSVKQRVEKDEINKWSYKMETIFHGRCSGIDNYVSTYGGTIYFESIKRDEIDIGKLKVIIIDTKRAKDTKKMVENVRRLKDENPEKVTKIFKKIKEIVNKVVRNRNEIKDQISENQKCLEDLGVSTEEIEKICELLKEYNISAKLSGAGMNSCYLK